MTSALNVVATLVASADHADDLRSALAGAIAAFRAEPGCTGYVLMEDLAQPGRFVTYETWTDRAALAQHMKSPTMQALQPAIENWVDGGVQQQMLETLVQL